MVYVNNLNLYETISSYSGGYWNSRRKTESEVTIEKNKFIKKVNDWVKQIHSGNRVYIKVSCIRSTRHDSIGYINLKKSNIPNEFASYDDYLEWRNSKPKFYISFDHSDNEKIPDLQIKDLTWVVVMAGEQDNISTEYIEYKREKRERKEVPDKKDSLSTTIEVGQACIFTDGSRNLYYGFISRINPDSKTAYVKRFNSAYETRIFYPESEIIVFNKGSDMYKKIVTMKLSAKL